MGVRLIWIQYNVQRETRRDTLRVECLDDMQEENRSNVSKSGNDYRLARDLEDAEAHFERLTDIDSWNQTVTSRYKQVIGTAAASLIVEKKLKSKYGFEVAKGKPFQAKAEVALMVYPQISLAVRIMQPLFSSPLSMLWLAAHKNVQTRKPSADHRYA